MKRVDLPDTALSEFAAELRDSAAARRRSLDILKKISPDDRDLLLVKALLTRPISHEELLDRQIPGNPTLDPVAVTEAFKKALASPARGDAAFMKMRERS